ncbi:Annexin A3 [Tupaia chinensis]|uniref:Annexin n=1 Tax=Tupaia chinensis TaxID=246437 RepID=L9KRW6_TUPCH|nr:Annexin A3 [Tupaia chinensis]
MENNRSGPAQIKCQERPEMKMITKEKTNDDIPDRGSSRSKGIELGKNSLNTSWVFRDLERDGQGESTPDDGKERDMSDRRERRGRLLQLSTQESCDCTLDNGSSTKNLGKVGNRGTVRDYPGFSPSIDAEAIHKAIKGIGTDEHMLISILAERSSIQRRLIAEAYEAAYGEELKDDLKGDLSGHFKCLMVALVTPPAVFDAKQLKKSMKGRRDESLKVDEHLAKKDAQVLYQAGENKWGTDEDKFTEILCLRSFPQLKLTFDEYRNICQKDIEDSIKGELSGHFEDLLLAIVPYRFQGAGTDEFTLNRIMVSRSEIDLLDIRAEFKKHYGYSLYSAIKSDTSGDYETTLLKICGGDD